MTSSSPTSQGKTRAACLIGWPAAHSRSPLIHHYWLRTLGIEGGYVIEAVPPQVLATAVAALVDPMVRDGLMLHLCPVGGEDPSCGGWRPAFSAAVPDRPWLGEDTAAERRLLLERLRSVAARTPDRWAAPVLTVLANTAWWVGDGTLAAVALARALRVDPGYRLAVLLDQLVSLGVRREAGRSRAA